MEFLSALFTAAFDSNVVFAQMVGMVAVFLLAFKPQDAVRFGLALWAATSISGLVGWPIFALFFEPWGIGYMAPIAYVLVSSIVVFLYGAVACTGKNEAARARIMTQCTLLAVNACVLAAPLGNAAAGEATTLAVATGSSIGAGLGAFIAVVLFATIRQRIDERLVPGALRGLPISLVTASLMCMAFSCVAGIAGGLFA